MTALLRPPTVAASTVEGADGTDGSVRPGTIELEDVLEGDLVFCARPGFLQQLCHRAGEPWRHVGLVIMVDGEPSICEVAGGRFGHRPLDALPGRYDTVAVGRVDPRYRAAAREAARWSARFSDRSQVYAWDDLILAGMIAVTRCYVHPDEEAVLERSLRAALIAMPPVPGTAASADSISFTCSSFVAEALHRAGVPIEIDLTASRCDGHRPTLIGLLRSRYRPLRAATGTRINREQLLTLTRALTLGVIAASTGLTGPDNADDLRRWATPGDLWRSPILADRWYLTRGPVPPVTGGD